MTWRVEDKGKSTKGSRGSLSTAPTAEERIVELECSRRPPRL